MVENELKQLHRSLLSSYLNAEELTELIFHSQIVSFSAGEKILQQGKKGNGIYIIMEGKALVTAKILGQGNTHLAILEEGQILGEMSFFDDSPCAATVTAETKVLCLFIKPSYFTMLSLYLPETYHHLLRAMSAELCRRLKNLHEKITGLMGRSHMAGISFLGTVMSSLTRINSVDLNKMPWDLNEYRHLPLFNNLSDKEYGQLLSYVEAISVDRQCTLITSGETEANCFFLLRGAVQSSIHQGNKAAKLAVLSPGSLFCPLTVIDESVPSVIHYATCERALLLQLSSAHLTTLKQTEPALWYKLFDLICHSFALLERSADKLNIRLNIETYNR